MLNLVIALVNTSGTMTKQLVRTKVKGYDEATSDEAFERMFERDKVTLRGLGIPVVTVNDDGHADDIAYRVDLAAYSLGELDLTPAELGVLSLAAQFWQDKNVRTDISRALIKIRSAGIEDAANDVVAGLAPRVRAVGGSYEPILDAIAARSAVTFTYRTASTGRSGSGRSSPGGSPHAAGAGTCSGTTATAAPHAPTGSTGWSVPSARWAHPERSRSRNRWTSTRCSGSPAPRGPSARRGWRCAPSERARCGRGERRRHGRRPRPARPALHVRLAPGRRGRGLRRRGRRARAGRRPRSRAGAVADRSRSGRQPWLSARTTGWSGCWASWPTSSRWVR
ncbi:hypothetical protein GCM10025865_29160 [Paraoerskovia sediminicola]|uniref:Uncharacterized protein n=1 Tax=Paraoerskovia sediminicola TaxID=1138587 RepID=A0ABM8G644_9CELL|nr:hypothetical protein GCM10025865_29160 [Paraoerskovia sediminicola]